MRRETVKLFIAESAQLACLLEVSAPKPGNVYPFSGFSDIGYEDFLIGAVKLSNIILTHLDRIGVGELIYRAVASTYVEVKTNVNLGIALLIVPLAKAYLEGSEGLRSSLYRVLDNLTVEDTVWVYKAMRMVSPGGLGRSDRADVYEEPNVTLKEAMIMAKDRDSIAYEYSSGYEISFDTVYPLIKRYREEGMSWSDTIVQAFLELISKIPDTLIARKFGREVALEVSEKVRRILDLGGVKTEEGRIAIKELDRELKGAKVKVNPGTSADLIASGLMIYFLLGGKLKRV